MYSLIIHRRRLVEFQKVWNLRFSVNIFQNASAYFSSNAAAELSLQDGRKRKTFTVPYLVDALGLTKKLAESITRKVNSEAKGNPDSVLNLLRSYGFTNSQISDIITDYPLLLMANAEKSIGPKLQFLLSRGASSSELTEIVSKVPKILGIKKDKAFSIYYDFIKEIIEADKSSKHVKLCHSLPPGCKQENKLRNVLVLRELGVPQKSESVAGKERFEESLKKVVGMGFDPTTLSFVQALHAVYQMSDKTIEGKVNVYKRLGFDVEDVWAMFKKWPNRDEVAMMVKCYPRCIGYSAESVKKKTEFVVKNMNWLLKAVALFPQAFGYSMEKRIVP
ncbi:hypothetical protein EUTSA_v10024124mg, partial [Eutrema salsugineum]